MTRQFLEKAKKVCRWTTKRDFLPKKSSLFLLLLFCCKKLRFQGRRIFAGPSFFLNGRRRRKKPFPDVPATKKNHLTFPPPGFLERSWYLKGRRDEMASTWWGDLKSPFSHRIKIKFAIRNILTPPFSWDPGLVRRNFDRCRSRSKPPSELSPSPWDPRCLLLHLSDGCRKFRAIFWRIVKKRSRKLVVFRTSTSTTAASKATIATTPTTTTTTTTTTIASKTATAAATFQTCSLSKLTGQLKLWSNSTFPMLISHGSHFLANLLSVGDG